MANKKCAHCGISDVPKTELIFTYNKYVHKHCRKEFEHKKYVQSLKKCAHCEIKDTPKDRLKVYEDVRETRTVKFLLHENCYDAFIEELEQRKQDRKELVELTDTILEIMNISVLPNQCFIKLANVRAGSGTGYVSTNSGAKKGYTYKQLREGFIRCQGDIDYALDHVGFDNITNAFAYALEIVVSNVGAIVMEQNRKAQGNDLAEIQLETFFSREDEEEVGEDALAKYRKPKEKPKKKSFFGEI